MRGRSQPDALIARLAGRQHGVVARRQLLAAGFASGAIERRLARGSLHPLHRGVYAVGHTVLTRQARWLAAVLASGAGAVLSHRSAATLWALGGWARRLVEVTVPRAQRARPGIELRRGPLPDDEWTVRDGIPVTTVPRTLFDLAAVTDARTLERAIAEAEVRRLHDPLSLAEIAARHPRRPGAATVRAVLAAERLGSGVTRSALEERFLALVDAAALPRPETNAHVPCRDGLVEVDCIWRAQRAIVELDGHAFHSSRAAYERDRARDRGLVAAGWHVARVTWLQLEREPDAVAADLARLLA
jgi:predicted transcriptional regulator of viral defense system